MTIKAPDALVGAIALEYVLLKLKPQLEEEPDFRGAFHVLSGFSAEQLVGFIEAKVKVGTRADRLQIQFPEFELRDYGVNSSFTTVDSSVNVRNRERNGSVVLTAEVEADAEASLADSDRTDASDLRDKEIADTWVDFVADSVGVNLLAEDRKKAEAMLKGLFDTGRCPTAKAGEFLTAVLTNFRNGEVFNRAAGKALPIIGLPLFEDCFSSLNDVKMALPSQWSAKFKNHYSLECYLDKRGLAQELLDPDRMRDRLSQLRSPEQMPPLPDAVLEAFQKYIESEGTRNPATEHLLFNFDWNYTTHCFDRAKKTSAKDFAERTRNALEAEGIEPTSDDTLVLNALTKIARKPGSASDEFQEFFERRSDALEKDSSLFLEWEDFIHGKKIECSDLYVGIFECLRRSIRGLAPAEDAFVVLEGRQQKKPNSFLEINQRACEFFERYYGNLETRTKRKIRFSETLICQYSQLVYPRIKDKPKFKGSSKSGKSTTLNFLASVYQKQAGGAERKVVTLSLSWKFPIGSVVGQETADFDAICRYHTQRGTALVECVAEYEVVGRKGLQMALSLENVEGFADVARGNGRGAFVPAQDRIKSLHAQWEKQLEDAALQHWLLPEQLSCLSSDFQAFHESYCRSVIALRKSCLDGDDVPALSETYRALLLRINELKHQDARRQLLRVVLKVGLAQVQRSGRRPPMAVVCPWHPLRLEATISRQHQILSLIDQLLGRDRPPFSDGANGTLFFQEFDQLLSHPLYPEVTVVWESTQAVPRVVTQTFGSYTLHQPPDQPSDSAMPSLDNDSKVAAAVIEHEMIEYLRLQPHERDNFSVLLYNCDSPALPTAVVDCINRINAGRDEDKITCQVLLMHRDDYHLRQIYRDLVARGVDTEADPTEASGDFLSKVRVNITAANKLRREGRSQPVDVAYCRDLISKEALPVWEWQQRETVPADILQPHQWSRRLPASAGERKVRLQLSCPAQSETGWAYLYSLAILSANGADDAWAVNKCPVLMRCLDFDNQHVERIFRETHELATWVVNQDELLDRKLLEAARDVKVIRYVHSSTHGRNLIISSGARETLLINTLREKLKALMISDTSSETIEALCKMFVTDANKISGGLILKAARRANNTNELLGMVLSRYLVQSEMGSIRPLAWCFLDDYSEWLGKKEGANIADLLVLAPKSNPDGSMHLDVVVTEAKFITHDGLGPACSTSSKQLMDTLSQLTEALNGDSLTMDQDIWLARLSDLLVSQTVSVAGQPALDTVTWRRAVRQRQCTVSIWGYSHIFVNEPYGLTAPISTVKGIQSSKGRASIDALQEIFSPAQVRELVSQYQEGNHKATSELRLSNGHPPFGKSKLYSLASSTDPKVTLKKSRSTPPENPDGGAAIVVNTNPVEPSPVAAPIKVEPVSPTQPVPPQSGPALVPSDNNSTALIEFLEIRSKELQTHEDTGPAWLEETTLRLRQALLARSLPAKLAEGIPPILTPNAGIIKLLGSKALTVQAIESHVSEIYTSEGLKIISTSPESGRISIAVERPERQILHSEPVLLSYLRDYDQATHGEKLCVGIREEDGKPLLLDPFNQPHTLVAGITGSGKSVLMQNLLLNIAATRSPEEAHIYLIDPKFGVDYRPLDELPHVEDGSGAIIDDPKDSLKLLASLVDEMNARYALFKKERGVSNIHSYRQNTGKSMPTLWVIHDEFADWMQTEDYKEAVPEIVGRLGAKARAAGIFLIFAAQRPDKDVMPPQFRSQLGNRLILKVDNVATGDIAMGIRNSGAECLLGRGHMLAKTGDMSDPVFVQVPFIDIPTISKVVDLIRARYKDRAGNSLNRLPQS